MKLLDCFFPTKKNGYRPIILRADSLSLVFLGLFAAQIFFNASVYDSLAPPQGKILGFATSIRQQELIDLTNAERVQRNLAPLTENPILDQAAQLKAQNIFAEDYWAHVSPSGITPWHWFDAAGYRYLMAGENLAKDFNTSAGVVAGWMGSQTHRENLLNPNFTEIGIAVMNGRLLGQETTLVVQFFGAPAVGLLGQSSPEPSPGPSPESSPPPVAARTFSLPNKGPAVRTQSNLSLSGRLGRLPFAFNSRVYTVSQLATLLVLALLAALFMIDSLVLWRVGVLRKNSHSLLHAGTLSLLLIALIVKSMGAIL